MLYNTAVHFSVILKAYPFLSIYLRDAQSMLPTACSKVAEFHSLQSQPVVKMLNPTAYSKYLAVFNG